MEKLTIAKINEIKRGLAMEKVLKEGVLGKELLKVAGSKYMVNVEYNGEITPVRVDFVVPKIKEDDVLQYAEDFADNYEQEQAEKRRLKEEREKTKAKKIARDKKMREEKREQ